MEILHQNYGGAASINIALFKEESPFTADQTNDAVNEVQNIVAQYEVFNEEQVCSCSSLVFALKTTSQMICSSPR